jgi:hypothetical protein
VPLNPFLCPYLFVLGSYPYLLVLLHPLSVHLLQQVLPQIFLVLLPALLKLASGVVTQFFYVFYLGKEGLRERDVGRK